MDSEHEKNESLEALRLELQRPIEVEESEEEREQAIAGFRRTMASIDKMSKVLSPFDGINLGMSGALAKLVQPHLGSSVLASLAKYEHPAISTELLKPIELPSYEFDGLLDELEPLPAPASADQMERLLELAGHQRDGIGELVSAIRTLAEEQVAERVASDERWQHQRRMNWLIAGLTGAAVVVGVISFFG